jgi:aspartyl-tRNA synthetase
MVLNGNEIGGGSIRIHDKATTANVQIFGFHRRTSQRTVWVLNGCISVWSTPHGGLALIRSISCHSWRAETIDFIAFPKNNSGRDVMIDAPS